MLTENADCKKRPLVKFFQYTGIFLVSRGSPRATNYFILFSEHFPVKKYPRPSSPFTHALLLLYLTCKEHLFVTLYVCFVHFFIFFLFHLFVLCPFLYIFSYCPFMVCLLMSHFSFSFPYVNFPSIYLLFVLFIYNFGFKHSFLLFTTAPLFVLLLNIPFITIRHLVLTAYL